MLAGNQRLVAHYLMMTYTKGRDGKLVLCCETERVPCRENAEQASARRF